MGGAPSVPGPCASFQRLSIYVETDDYPETNSWTLKKLELDGTYTTVETQSFTEPRFLHKTDICLDNLTTYKWMIIDTNGDGLCIDEDVCGNFALFMNLDELVFANTDFTSSIEHEFTTAPLPSAAPSEAPSFSPSLLPSDQPTISDQPSSVPSSTPSFRPSKSNYPSLSPSAAPSRDVTKPTVGPSDAPTDYPSGSPTASPSDSPSYSPSAPPTTSPSDAPSDSPTVCEDAERKFTGTRPGGRKITEDCIWVSRRIKKRGANPENTCTYTIDDGTPIHDLCKKTCGEYGFGPCAYLA